MFDQISQSIDEFGNSVLNALNNVQGFFGKDLSIAVPIKENIFQTIGNTPLVRLSKIGSHIKGANFYLKSEFSNPTGSVKDRTAYGMIRDFEKRGLLKDGSTIVDSSSGNLSVSLAWIGKALGYKVKSFVSKSISENVLKKLKFFDAEIIFISDSDCETEEKKRKFILEKISSRSDFVLLDQYTNMANPNIHLKSTGSEIFRDLSGNVDAFVSGVDSGGVITGVGRFLKSQKESIKVVATFSTGSKIFSHSASRSGKVESANLKARLPETFDTKLVNSTYFITEEDCLFYQQELASKEGIYAGITTGLNLAAAVKFAEDATSTNEFEKEFHLVLLAPDKMEF